MNSINLQTLIIESYKNWLGDDLLALMKQGSFDTSNFIPTWSDVDFAIFCNDNLEIIKANHIRKLIEQEVMYDIGTTFVTNRQLKMIDKGISLIHPKAFQSMLENELHQDLLFYAKDGFVLPKIGDSLRVQEAYNTMIDLYNELLKIITREYLQESLESRKIIYKRIIKISFIILKKYLIWKELGIPRGKHETIRLAKNAGLDMSIFESYLEDILNWEKVYSKVINIDIIVSRNFDFLNSIVY